MLKVFKVQKGICLTILDEAYVSKIAVLRETNLQDCNPEQSSQSLSLQNYFWASRNGSIV